MKQTLIRKWFQFAFLTSGMLFAGGCVVTADDLSNAVAAPVTGAISDVIGAVLNTWLTNAGLLPGS